MPFGFDKFDKKSNFEFKKQFGNEMGDSLADSAEVLFRMLQKARANVPGYSEDLPARLNMWGDVVAY